jgi:hypothetical protein
MINNNKITKLMKLSLRIITLLFLVNVCYAQVSPKRGIAYGSNSLSDMNTLKKGVSWWYNWTNVPDAGLVNYYSSLGVEYVPMAWNSNFNTTDFISKIKPGAKYLLTFNEPNLSVESNMTPEQAASAWPQIEQIASAKNLEIVSAAAIYCSGGVGGYNDPIAWHNQFFKVCPNCKVDYIAFHTYEGTSGGAIALTNNVTVFNRPVWITEFSDYNASSASIENQYMLDVVNSYEGNPDVFRYSWFTGRRSDAPVINIYGNDGVLTPLGNTYVGIPYTNKKMDVPGRIIGNKHYRRKGSQLENTTDGNTGQNISSINIGGWAEFMLNVTKAGSHDMTFRVASLNNGGKFDILINDKIVKSDVTFSATGGWQTWSDVLVSGITLPSGEVYLKVVYKTNGFNLNYIDDVFKSTITGLSKDNNQTFLFYPNPFNNTASLRINSENNDKVKVKIIDLRGSLVYTSESFITNKDYQIGEDFTNGIYSVLINYGSEVKTFKMIKIK